MAIKLYRLSIIGAYLVVRKNLYISAQGRAKAGTRQLIEERYTLYKFGIMYKIIRLAGC